MQQEKLITLDEARRLPWLPRPVSLPTMYRHAGHGLRGVRLRVVRTAAGLCTTESWLAEFYAAAGGPPAPRSSGERTSQYRKAEAQLDSVGI